MSQTIQAVQGLHPAAQCVALVALAIVGVAICWAIVRFFDK